MLSFRKTQRQINEGKQFSDNKCETRKQSDVGTLRVGSWGWEGGDGPPGMGRCIQGPATRLVQLRTVGEMSGSETELSRAWGFSYEGAEFLFHTLRKKRSISSNRMAISDTQANPFLAFVWRMDGLW